MNQPIQKIGQAKSIQRQKAHTMQKVLWHVRWIVLSLLIIFNAIGLNEQSSCSIFSSYQWNRF